MVVWAAGEQSGEGWGGVYKGMCDYEGCWDGRLILAIVGTVGRFEDGHFSYGVVQYHVGATFECAGTYHGEDEADHRKSFQREEI